jgi:hypothetical protein
VSWTRLSVEVGEKHMRNENTGQWRIGLSSAVIAIATAILAATSIVGLVYIMSELAELRRQNSYLERTMRQSYRPLGVTRYKQDDTTRTWILISYSRASKANKICIDGRPILRNVGDGMLYYIGTLSRRFSEEHDFRCELLKGEIDTVSIDGVPSWERREAIMPGSELSVLFHLDNLDHEVLCYLYTLFLYEDQDGNLYDTERLDVLHFEKDVELVDGVLRPRLVEGTGRGGSHEMHHDYTPHERQQLIAFFRDMDHDLARVLSPASDCSTMK